ncbi:MAG: hypothetical protein Ct9H300mP17_04440 [Candidatus Nitrosopelagicus sp.]|nr:MAG: hypothetical protein Ct9H300mP17_04440 [Candidatus Nitrosopelagicus sp.]
MEKFKTIKVGNSFVSTTSISKKKLDEYLGFSRIKNAMFEIDSGKDENRVISGRAIISRMEGEFTRLRQIYGNYIVLYGIDGDEEWKNRQTRFVRPVYTDQVLRLKYTISDKRDIDDEYGLISVDFEATFEDGELVLTSKRNLYRIKKEPPSNR